jgi:hypothetical protein
MGKMPIASPNWRACLEYLLAMPARQREEARAVLGGHPTSRAELPKDHPAGGVTEH